MTYEEAFKLCAETGNVSQDTEGLKIKRPNKKQLRECLLRMVENGVTLDKAREALWTVEEYFDKKEKTNE